MAQKAHDLTYDFRTSWQHRNLHWHVSITKRQWQDILVGAPNTSTKPPGSYGSGLKSSVSKASMLNAQSWISVSVVIPTSHWSVNAKNAQHHPNMPTLAHIHTDAQSPQSRRTQKILTDAPAHMYRARPRRQKLSNRFTSSPIIVQYNLASWPRRLKI